MDGIAGLDEQCFVFKIPDFTPFSFGVDMFAKAAFSDKTYSFRELNEESIKKIKEMLSDALNVTIWDDNPERAAKISQHILDTQWSVDMSENDKAKAPAVWKIASSFVDQLNRDHFMNIIK